MVSKFCVSNASMCFSRSSSSRLCCSHKSEKLSFTVSHCSFNATEGANPFDLLALILLVLTLLSLLSDST